MDSIGAVDRFVEAVCKALNNYSSDIQHKAKSAYYDGKKLKDTIKALK